MKKLGFLSILLLLAAPLAQADDPSQADHPDAKERMEKFAKHQCSEGDQQCIQDHENKMKEHAEKIKTRIQEKCGGDEKCMTEAHEKIKARRQKIHEEIKKECPDGGAECKKEALQKMKEKFKTRREEHRQNKQAGNDTSTT